MKYINLYQNPTPQEINSNPTWVESFSADDWNQLYGSALSNHPQQQTEFSLMANTQIVYLGEYDNVQFFLPLRSIFMRFVYDDAPVQNVMYLKCWDTAVDLDMLFQDKDYGYADFNGLHLLMAGTLYGVDSKLSKLYTIELQEEQAMIMNSLYTGQRIAPTKAITALINNASLVDSFS